MKPDRIATALEEASHLIGRLDARISASPLAEAWQVRACFWAAERLAAVDGTPTRSADILGLMTETPLPHPAAYLPATAGFGHWRRCMARVELSELASILIGREPSKAMRYAEDQAEWDMEAILPSSRRRISASAEETVDDYARDVSDRALKILESVEIKGPILLGVAEGLQTAIRMDPDPDYFERVYELRKRIEREFRAEADRAKSALPSPLDDGEVDLKRQRIDARFDAILGGIEWDKRRHLGSCFAVIPDRFQSLGFTANRLSCLTGANKRMGFEGRLDDRAVLIFLRQLAHDARAGLALLDGLEEVMAAFGSSPDTKFDARSPFPDIMYAFLVFPAVDVNWLEMALEVHKRVVQKFIKRLSDAGLIVYWADAKRSRLDGQGTRETRLWTASAFEKEFDLALRRRRSWKPAIVIKAQDMLERPRDERVSKPMSVVYQEFDDQLVDIDREFGRFFDQKWWKNRSSRKPVERENRPSPTGETSEA